MTATAADWTRGRLSLLAGVARRALVLGCALGLLAAPIPLSAQGLNPLTGEMELDPDAQMLLEADELIYDFDRRTVSAVGSVRVFYGGHTVEAGRVTYHQDSGRLIASDGVRIVEPRGNVITAREIDITDDFRDGFIQSLHIETMERTRFAAETAERRDGEITEFRRGVYTACEPCEDDPLRPPLWQIKASRIVHNQVTQTVSYRDARLEFFGVPVAYFPYFQHPDPSVKRKTGFLIPMVRHTEALGYGVTAPFFWALAPNYDLTFRPTYYTRQGLLGQVEWRHRLMQGAYSIRVAGILQRDPGAFAGRSGERERRGSIASHGLFGIAPDWWLGWDVFASSDRLFGRNYRIDRRDAVPSTVHLTRIRERDYFDLRGYHFRIQREDQSELDFQTVEGVKAVRDFGGLGAARRALAREAGFVFPRSHARAGQGNVNAAIRALDNAPDTVPPLLRELLGEEVRHSLQGQQAIVHPVLDHSYIFDMSVLGGELRLDSNFTALSRRITDLRVRAPLDSFNGVAGTFARASHQLSWQRSMIGPLGQQFTPFAYLKADLFWLDPDDPRPGLVESDTAWRAMPAVGLEYRWPFIAVSSWGTQTFGPMAQIIVRPDEQHVGELPNEDAHSLVFDETNLFARDKFSGIDRQEGGTRANVGFQYQGRLNNGMGVDAVFGQSFHLAGANSFADRGLTLTGVGSGLETSRSDYVARVTLDTGGPLSLTARGRFDEANFDLNRGELSASAAYGRSDVSVGYVFMREDPLIGVPEDRQEVRTRARLALSENWSVAGRLIYDVQHQSRVGQALGLAYDDECLNISLTYVERHERFTDELDRRQVTLRINLRTLGGTAYTQRIEQ